MRYATLIPVFFLTFSLAIYGQDVAFDYDADGNLTSRYVLTLRSAQTGTQPEDTTETAEEEELYPEEAVTIALAESRITIYPNPTRGKISIEINPFLPQGENFLQLYDAAGRGILSKPISSTVTGLDIAGPPGIHLLNIHLNGKVSRWKIIKQ
jgi:hypothetical protein